MLNTYGAKKKTYEPIYIAMSSLSFCLLVIASLAPHFVVSPKLSPTSLFLPVIFSITFAFYDAFTLRSVLRLRMSSTSCSVVVFTLKQFEIKVNTKNAILYKWHIELLNLLVILNNSSFFFLIKANF